MLLQSGIQQFKPCQNQVFPASSDPPMTSSTVPGHSQPKLASESPVTSLTLTGVGGYD
jgi:hypothetical protein